VWGRLCWVGSDGSRMFTQATDDGTEWTILGAGGEVRSTYRLGGGLTDEAFT
jgi:hypothetical protein